MELGAFSISLTVKDLKKSRAFYEGLGFSGHEGADYETWCVLKNGDTIIGLFQGMFDKNMLTFNPGWDQNAQKLDSFKDIRDLQKDLKAKNYTFANEADETTIGPASFVLIDPDGNPILVDQHV